MLLTYIYHSTTSCVSYSSADVHMGHQKSATLEYARGVGVGKSPILIL